MKETGISTKIPVIVLTSEKSSEIESLHLGAADFLTKPYDLPEVILARVRHSIELFENSRIIQATKRDKLTELYNPRFFLEYASQIDARYPEIIFDAIVINFTRFHLLNELKGRGFGDQVLQAVAEGIRSALKQKGGIAGRKDADTFYIYAQHSEDFTLFIDSIKTALSPLLKGSEIRLHLGAFSDTNHSHSIVECFDHALQACNSIRSKAGKNGEEICIFDKEMIEKEKFDAHLLHDFEAALEQKQFKVNYQPKFNITGDKPLLCSAEALIRWIHPEFGFVRPDLFIPLFEEHGLVTLLDRYVWEKSAR